jgi:hypothetical protein
MAVTVQKNATMAGTWFNLAVEGSCLRQTVRSLRDAQENSANTQEKPTSTHPIDQNG